MLEAIKDFFTDIRAAVRTKLRKLPPIEVIWREREAYLAALGRIGDKVSALEPEDLAKLDYVRFAVRAAQFAAGKKLPGLAKLAEVEAAVKVAWIAAKYADDQFDKFWLGTARPFIDAYVAEVKANDAWTPPT